jgi:hypothetical protein
LTPAAETPSVYSHTQFGTLMATVLGVATAVFLMMAVASDSKAMPLAAAGLLAAALALFHSLTVRVTADEVIVAFGPGLIRKRFHVNEIRGVQVVRNHWYYGWGIRWTPHGWLYAVSGLDAVQITLDNGRRYRIGTDRPRELSFALKNAIESHVGT